MRPLSQHYFNLYSKKLQEKRIKYRPGLVPPYYADMPETLEEIQASEMRYLESFEKKPLRTQWRYFWKAIGNIIVQKGAVFVICPVVHNILIFRPNPDCEMILVTGGTGLLGSHLLLELVREHEEVVALKRTSSDLEEVKACFLLLFQ